METVCPQCFAAIDADELVSGSELSCPFCGGCFRIRQSLTLPATAIRDSDTVHQPHKEHTVLRPANDDNTLDPPNDDNTISRLDAPAPSPLAVSQQRLGRFILFNVVGSGGFGDVYRAYDTDLQRVVAIKVPKANIAERPDLLERVHREAKSAGQLHHPAIVAVLEWGESDHLPFIVYEFVTGVTLSQHRTQSDSRLDYRETATHIRDMAEGLHYAHEHGVTHRDVKPSNIMIDENGAARLTDFGLAKLQDPETNTLTQTGDVLGTAAYMSPEQALGQIDEIDARSDIYSLGATLYEMLCGRRQFLGNPIELIHKAVSEEPSQLRSLDASIPADLEAICHKSVEKDKKHRYQTAQEMADDLNRWLHNRPTKVRRPGPIGQAWRWCRRNRVIAAATTIVLAIMSVATIVTGLAYRDSLESLAVANLSLSRLYIQKANSYPDEDIMLALPRVVAAAEIDKDIPNRLAAHELRLAIGLASHPTLEKIHSLDSKLKHVAATADGRFVLTVGEDDDIRFWDTSVLDKAIWTWNYGEDPGKCCLSTGGQFAAVVDNEGVRVYIWDTGTGELVSVLDHTVLGESGVECVQFQPIQNESTDSVLLASGYGETACIWDVRSGQLLTRLQHDAKVLVTQFDRTGQVLQTGAADSTARLWEALPPPPADAQPMPVAIFYHRSIQQAIRRDQSDVVFVGGGPDRTIVTVTDGGTVSIWDRQNPKPIFESSEESPSVTPRRNRLNVIAISPDGRLLALPHGKSTTIWNLDEQRIVGEPFEGASDVSVQRFTDDRILAIGRKDGELDMVTIEDDAIVRNGPRIYHESEIRIVFADATHPTAELRELCTYTAGGLVRRWSPPTFNSRSISTALSSIENFHTDQCQSTVVLHPGSPYEPVVVYDVDNETCKAMAETLPHKDNALARLNIFESAISPDGKWIAAAGAIGTQSAGFHGSVVIWDARTGERVVDSLPIEAPFMPTRSIGFDSTSTYLMVDARRRGGERLASFWRVTDATLVHSHKAKFKDVFWSGKAHEACVVMQDTLELLDVTNAGASGKPLKHSSPVQRVKYDATVASIVTQCQDGTLNCWSMDSYRKVGTASGAQGVGSIGDVNALAGLVALIDAKTIRVLNMDAGLSTRTLISTINPNVFCRFTPDGRFLLLADNAGVATLWDALQGERIGRIAEWSHKILDAEFIDDGKELLVACKSQSGGSQGTFMQRLQLDLGDSTLNSLRRRVGVASGRRVGEYGQLESVPVELLYMQFSK